MVESRSHLVREMRETCDVIRRLDVDAIAAFGSGIRHERILFTGEGSSRIFPSKKVRSDALVRGYRESLESEGATQALDYELGAHTVIAASNSGRTKEVVRLLERLRGAGHDDLLALTAGKDTPLEAHAHRTYHLISGAEQAVAATKSVVEQALFYDLLFSSRNGSHAAALPALAEAFREAFEAPTAPEIRDALVHSGRIYWAGRNDGVAEELTLKTNEITRKCADFLEGTYAVHGIEEVMEPNDVVIILRPFPEEERKFEEVLVRGVGLTVVAVTSAPSRFPSIVISEVGPLAPYVELAAGWNLLVETGVALGIDLDKPVRARKVGNEVEPG